MAETEAIKRAHQWTPPRQGVRSVCKRCGMIRERATTGYCYVEQAPDTAIEGE